MNSIQDYTRKVENLKPSSERDATINKMPTDGSTVEVVSDDDTNNSLSSFEAICKLINCAHEHAREPHWYQLVYDDKSKCYEEVGTVHSLLGLDEKQTMEILKSAKLLFQNRKKQMAVNNEVFLNLAKQLLWSELIKAEDLVTFRHGTGRNTFIYIGRPSDGKVDSLRDQLSLKLPPPELDLAQVQDWFQLVPCIRRIVSADNIENATADLSNSDHQTENCLNDFRQLTITVDEDHLGDGYKRGRSYFDDPVTDGKSKKRRMLFRQTLCNGQMVTCPNGYKIVHKTRKQNSDEALEAKRRMNDKLKKKEHRLPLAVKLCLGTCAANFPQVSDAAAEQFLYQGILIGMTVLEMANLEDGSGIDIDTMMSIKPSTTTVHNHVVTTAAHKVVLLGNRMANASRIYLAADHGAGILAKIAYFWDKKSKAIVAVNLDFDTSGDSAKEGAVATKHSFKKYVYGSTEEEQNVKMQGLINGGASDSGGGFTKDAMKNSLVEVGIACQKTWIFCACTAHNDQTNLRHGMEKVYGIGGLEERTIQQLIHAYSDWQDAIRDKCGNDGLKKLLEKAYEHTRGSSAPATVLKELLKMMQEPIVTRWKTIGMALIYVAKFFDVLFAAVRASNASNNKNTQIGKTGANFVSLSKERALACDCAFLAGFDKIFFNPNFEFNHATDPNIGRSAFLVPHHLARYCIKDKGLRDILNELESGSVDKAPANPRFPLFWEKLQDVLDLTEKQDCLGKAKLFIKSYIESLDKHNEQFCNDQLLFLACFGETPVAQIVAKFLIDGDLTATIQDNQTSHYSTLQRQSIRLDEFAKFVSAKCTAEARLECVKSKNFQDFKHIVELIAGGHDFWGATGDQAEQYRERYLEHFGAIPSTTEDVERVVKRARLCQKTGKEERSVTIYGIAGDAVSRACTESLVTSNYHNDQKKQREDYNEKAAAEGRKQKDKYQPDLERGPGMTLNLCNHAMKLLQDGRELAAEIGVEEFESRVKAAKDALRSIEKQGSKIRSDAAIQKAVENLGKDYVPSAREIITGVDVTPAMRNQVVLNKCTMTICPHNKAAMFDEALCRGLVQEGDWQDYDSKTGHLTFVKVRKRIAEYEVAEWIRTHNGNPNPPGNVGKAITLLSTKHKLVAKA